MTPYVLGIDVGQSGVRVAAVDAAGRVLSLCRIPEQIRVGPDRAEHDASRWLAAVSDGVHRVTAECQGHMVAGVAAGALGPVPVLVDADLRPLAAAPLYRLDPRAPSRRQDFELASGLSPGTLTLDHAAATIHWWRRCQPDVVERAAHILDATGLIVGMLTGQAAMDEVTGREYFAVPDGSRDSLLPPELRATDVVGVVRPGGHSGLPPGVPVLMGSIDSFVDLYAAGLGAGTEGALVLGSTAVIARVLPERYAIPQPQGGAGIGEVSRYIGPGRIAATWTGAAGSAMEWCRTVLAASPGLDDVERLTPGAGGLLASAHLAPGARASQGGYLTGLTLATTAAQMARAVLDAVALDVARAVWSLQAAGLGLDAWRGWGGGFTNAILARAVVDAMGVPVEVMPSTGTGAAELARRVLLDTAPGASERRLDPDPVRHDSYRRLAQLSEDVSGVTGGRVTEG